MDRREFLLGTSSAMAVGTFGGCLSSDAGADEQSTTRETVASTTTPTPTPTPTTATPEPAEFELVQVDAPESVEIGQDMQFSFTVENVGGRASTFETAVSYRTSDSDWDTTDPWSRMIPPGETRTMISDKFSYPYMTEYELNIDEFDKQFSIKVVSRTLSYGETYRISNDIDLTISGVALMDQYKIERDINDYLIVEADPGKQWAFVYLSAENKAGSPAIAPYPSDFDLIAAERQYEPLNFYRREGEYEGGNLQAGIVRDGWVGFQIPASYSESDVRVVWSESYTYGDVAVYWSQNGGGGS